MKYIHDDFLLTTKTAERLYHQHAEKMPIIDYHCHLEPKDIAEDRHFENITQIWLYGDHYKWRLMRNCGVSERLITGDASDKEKFMAWAEVLQQCIGNPLYQWSMLELSRYFDFTEPLNSENAEEAWEQCNRVIHENGLSAVQIIEKSRVELLCTTDNPEDDLHWHKQIKDDPNIAVRVLPAFRPDRAFKIDAEDFDEYISVLEERFSRKISSYKDFTAAMRSAVEYFEENGCRTSDHGLDYVPYRAADDDEVEAVFAKARRGEAISVEEKEKYQTALLTELAKEYSRYGWIMQLHYGASRDNNRRMFDMLGANTGYDCISGTKSGNNLPRLLDSLESRGILPKTVVYSLDPIENAMIDTICGCYHEEGIRGKVQHGSAWWFNDHFNGMKEQIENLAAHSVLANFIGMLTDSRSFLSYTRHEYFRRLLCRLLGEWVEKGDYPNDESTLARIVENVSYYNTLEFFDFEKHKGGNK